MNTVTEKPASTTDADTQTAALIVAYYRKEIGRLMHQAEHWAANNKPLAVHHRLHKADAYYQIVVLFERMGQHGQNPFDEMRRELARPCINPPGIYPPSTDLYRYREPAFVFEKLNEGLRR